MSRISTVFYWKADIIPHKTVCRAYVRLRYTYCSNIEYLQHGGDKCRQQKDVMYTVVYLGFQKVGGLQYLPIFAHYWRNIKVLRCLVVKLH